LGRSIVIIICLKVDVGLHITLFVFFLTAFSLIVSDVMFMFWIDLYIYLQFDFTCFNG